MTAELRNYLRRCFSPLFAASAVASFVSRALGSALGRWVPDSRYASVDRRIMRLRQRLIAQTHTLERQQAAQEPWVPYALTLAVGSFEVGKESDWTTGFPDIEVTVSLHRWTWLLRGLTDDRVPLSRERGIELMRSWVRHCQGRPELSADAYTTGERIVNGCLFLLLTGEGAIPGDLAAAFRRMGCEVALHLEYYPGELAGNHAFNNARALLFAGLLAELPGAVELAEVICAERLAELITADGFLREGSSHYHFLFTRWVLEMLWLCDRTQYAQLARILQPHARVLVQRCWFFLVASHAGGDWTIPLVGDVSPDFPVEWLLGVPWSSLACSVYQPEELPQGPRAVGWANLFGVASGNGHSRPADAVASFPASGWLRVDHSPWSLFVRAESRDGGLRADHAHHDLGGFVLFHAGEPLLVDCGRLDYTDEPTGAYGKSAAAHNTVFVDGLASSCDGPNWLASRYRSVRVTMESERRGEHVTVVLRHDGFSRLAGGAAIHERRFDIGRASFGIEDRLRGTGTHEVRVRFHFAPGVELREAGNRQWRIGNSSLRFAAPALPGSEIQVARPHPPLGGWFFPAYGRRVAATTLDFAGVVEFPAALTQAVLAEVR